MKKTEALERLIKLQDEKIAEIDKAIEFKNSLVSSLEKQVADLKKEVVSGKITIYKYPNGDSIQVGDFIELGLSNPQEQKAIVTYMEYATEDSKGFVDNNYGLAARSTSTVEFIETIPSLIKENIKIVKIPNG